MFSACIDIGGTFTDLIVASTAALVTASCQSRETDVPRTYP